MGLCAVDPYGDLSAGGTKFLEESAVSPDPEVLLCDLHLRIKSMYVTQLLNQI